MTVNIDWYTESRAPLRPLFEEAEDSAIQLDSYIKLGRVLVARIASQIIGHLQLIDTNDPKVIEIKSLAVSPEHRGQDVGRALVTAAIKRCADEGFARIVLSTATADVGNLRFYQRMGFRFESIDRDAFTPATGYPVPIDIDGIALCDRIWLDFTLPTSAA